MSCRPAHPHRSVPPPTVRIELHGRVTIRGRSPGCAGPLGRSDPDDLLYDDGTHLWAYRLTGKRRLIWNHPTVQVAVLAAGPGGRDLALSINLNPTGRSQPSSVLYLLGSDGSIRVADAVNHFAYIGSAAFLRNISETGGTARLYWVRWGDEISKSAGGLDNQVMVDAGGQPISVSFPLRLGEAPFQVAGYPGGVGITVAIYRHVDVPAQYEVLKNAGTTDVSSPFHWGEFTSRGFTDSNLDIVWINPSEYVRSRIRRCPPEKRDDACLRG